MCLHSSALDLSTSRREMRAIISLLVLCICFAAAAPIIVLHKSVSENNVLLGTDVTISTTAINIGDESAFDFHMVDGDASKEVAVLEAQANVTVVTTIKANELGNLIVKPATASWALSAGANERLRATSNEVREEERDEKRHATELGPRGYINVITASEYSRINSRFIQETVLYLLFAGAIILFPFGVYRQKQIQVDFHLKEARKK